MATPKQTNKNLVRRVFESLNERQQDAFAETHAEDVVLHDHDEEIHGIDATIAHEWTIYDAFPDMEYTLADVLAEDDAVACRWTVSGTHEGEFEGIDPTGEEIEIPACGVLRIEDGSVAEVWLNDDRLGMLQQLGVVEPATG